MNVIKFPTAENDSSHGPQRSTPGQGEQCFIYVLGRADQYADSVVPSYGQISAGCGPNIREDFAETTWPVVVKVKPHVTERDLIQHLRDLADAIEEHTKPKDLQRTLGARWSRQPDHTEPTEKERRLGIVASGDLDSEIPF